MAGRKRISSLVAVAVVAAAATSFYGCESIQRKALFHPAHEKRETTLARWVHDGQVIGYAREVSHPRNVWLLLHGNAGQAEDRTYALPAFAPDDSVFILEYPGYGQRAGKPSRASIDAAARQAYSLLRARFPETPICVAAESIGSGPASVLARERLPPDKFVFVVPFDDLKAVARDYLKVSSAGSLLAGSWNNLEAMAGYRGPVDIFGAARDQVIPVAHARALAAILPQAKFQVIPAGHNEWPAQREVRFRNP